jgi:hypothetical protein
MEIKKLIEWNPWWETNSVSDALKGKPRQNYQPLIDSVNIKEITIILGVRRSGKSTLMYQMIDNLLSNKIDPKQVLFVNLEDNKLREDSLEEIYSAYRSSLNPNKKTYFFIDEIHREEEWESWIRKKYDLKENCKFVVSGSCFIKKEYSTLLTGRNLTFEVFPLSFEEYLDFKGISFDKNKVRQGLITNKTKYLIMNHLEDYMKQGGFPEISFAKEEFKAMVLKQYFDDILYKDIIKRYNINTKKVQDLAIYLMTNFTNKFSLRTIRNTLKIAYDSIQDYLSYFIEAYLFFLQDYFSYSLKKQKTRASKIYCIDNGLRNATSFKFSEDYGRLAENLVFIELKRRKQEAFYWDEKGEVDFVVKDGAELTPINVTHSDGIDKREINALKAFKARFNKNVKRMLVLTKDVESKEAEIEFIPLWKWLLT